MKKYKLENLDCANCAFKIEEGLKKLEGVKDVSVNFATGVLRIDASDTEKAINEIKKIEPEVAVKPLNDKEHSHDENESKFDKTEITFILLSGALFVAGIVFKKLLHDTPFSVAEYTVFLTAYILSGRKVLFSAIKNTGHGRFFDENFLLTVATTGAIFIHELPEAVGVMLFFEIGEFFQDLAVGNSRKSIKALLRSKPNYANLLMGKAIKKVAPEEVKISDIVLVNPGEKIPLDGIVVSGSSQLDTSPLTGESMPRNVTEGEKVLAGMVNQFGMLKIKVTAPFEESSISKIMNLTENALSRKTKTEKFITQFAKYYTPLVVFGALAVATLPPMIIPGATFSEWIYRALILLVISCPCALVISIPLGYFGGVGASSKKGILIKGSNFLDSLSKLKTVVFDKTGTLTEGVFKVKDIAPTNGVKKEVLLEIASLVESHSNHPIARSIVEAYNRKVDSSKVESYEEISGYGIKARINDDIVVVGNDRLLHKEKIVHNTCDIPGTVVHVALNNVYVGYITISDVIKEDAKETIVDLKKLGVEETVMLTGDSKEVAGYVAKELGIDSYHAELLPDEKLKILEKIMKGSKNRVAFVGDGINDAPVIARADVGIAMGGIGSDAAVETADVVIMTDKPSKVAEGIRIGRKTQRIVWENIIFALTVKSAFLVLGVVGMATMWEAVFADVGVALIAIFNAGRIIYGERGNGHA